MIRPAAVWLAVCTLILLILPWIIGNEFYVNMASQVLIYALFALSINMMLGYGGMVSLGHAGYLGIAGYACILATTAGYDQLTAAIFAVAISTLSAAFFGVLSLRAPGLGFIMITLALGQIVWASPIARTTSPAATTASGIRRGRCRSASTSRRAELLLFHAGRVRDRAVLHLAILALAVRREPDGHARPAAPHAHARHNVWLIRLVTFVMAGFWGSVASVLYVYYNLFLSPHAISLQQSAEILLMAILGGASSLTGPIVGAAIITLVKNVISTYVERWNTLLGVIFVVVIMFMPYGLVPGCTQLWRRWRNRSKAVGSAAEPAE